MQRLVLRSHSIRNVTLSFSIRHYLFDHHFYVTPAVSISGLVNPFRSQSRKVHTTSSHWRVKDRTERINDVQTSFFKKSNAYIADQKDKYGSDRHSNQRKNDFFYKHKHQGSSDYDTGRDLHRNHSVRNGNRNVTEHYNEQIEDVQSPEAEDDNDDTFGTLARDAGTFPKWLQDEDLDEPYEMEEPHRRLSAENRPHDQDWYFKKIVEMGKEGKVFEAIAVLDEWMLVRDRVMPNAEIYSAVIGIIGRTGNAKLAFKHFRKMRQFGLKPNDATLTALFNACSNCPDKGIAIKKANYLRNYLRRAEIKPNIITYNSMIKMYGRMGDLPSAFLVADEALSNRRAADSFFFGSLLSAAVSDKEEGLLYAIEVWRRMKIMTFKPDIFHYKLMLHAVAECRLGSEEQQKILLQPYVPYRKQKAKQKQIGTGTEITPLLSSPQHSNQVLLKYEGEHEEVKSQKSPETIKPEKQAKESQSELYREQDPDKTAMSLLSVPDNTAVSVLSEEQVDSSPSSVTVVAKFPDLLDPKESFSEVISLGNMSESKDRLLLMGGIKGFLQRMKADKIRPDITVLTWLVQMKRGKEDEEIILSALEEGKMKADPTFLNALMRSKAHEESFDDAKAVLQLFSKYNVVPNRQTYGSLLFCTRNPDEAREILKSMENAGLAPDIKTFSILIGKGAGHFTFKKYLLRKMETMNVKPDMHFLKIIERHLQKIREQILAEQRQNTKNSKIRRLERDLEDLNVFYEQWLRKTKVHEKVHPLDNYKKKQLTSGTE